MQLRDVAAPVLVRFPDILDNRIEKVSLGENMKRKVISMILRRWKGFCLAAEEEALFPRGAETVSYTHLDVYKRQMQKSQV